MDKNLKEIFDWYDTLSTCVLETKDLVAFMIADGDLTEEEVIKYFKERHSDTVKMPDIYQMIEELQSDEEEF